MPLKFQWAKNSNPISNEKLAMIEIVYSQDNYSENIL